MVLLLLLFQLVVERLELTTLIALTAGKHRVDVLSEGDFGAEPVDLVVVGVARHAKVLDSALSLLAASRKFIEVGSLLHHAQSTFIVVV